MAVTIEQIKELRNLTGAGVNAVKEAIEHSGGDTDKAIAYLREKGVAKAAKRAGKEAQNGTLGTYVHGDKRTVVVIEVATETDFAARSEEIQKFATDLALHIAAVGTEYLTEEMVPAEIVEQQKEEAKKDVEGKPEEIANKIIEGKIMKFYKENVLLHQPLFIDDSKTVGDYMNEIVAKIGEKVELTRFVKMQIAQPTTYCNL